MEALKYKNDIIKKPWGQYQVLETSKDYQTKEIIVKPQRRLSLQKHKKRDELWTIIKGKAEVILNDKKLKLVKGDEVFIPRNSLHRVKNIGSKNLIIKELQTGEYFGEDDIIRFKDDYGRV